MNCREIATRKRLKDEGWTVLRGGWPDFFCIRSQNGIIEAMGVEVKSPTDRVRPNQRKMHRALKRAGIPVIVEADEVLIFLSVTRNDQRLLQALQKKLDHPTYSETIRQAVREFAALKGVK